MKNAWSWTQWGGLKGEEIEFEGKQMVLPPGKALWRPLITEEFSNITETNGNYMDRFKYNFLIEPYEGESLPFHPISNLNEIWQPPDEWLDKGDLNERLREEKACVIVEEKLVVGEKDLTIEMSKFRKEEEFSMIDIFDNTGGEYPPYPPEEEDKTREPQVEDPEDFGGSK